MDEQLIAFAALAGSSLLALAALSWLALRQRRARREARVLREQLERLQRDVQALCAGASGLGGHVGRLQQELRRLAERDDRIDLRDSRRREYDDAVRLAKGGLDVDQLVAKCRLGRAEAELLVGLHGGGRRGLDYGGGMSASGLPM
jgi:hypothetical protein